MANKKTGPMTEKLKKPKPWKLAGFDSEEEWHFSFWLEEAVFGKYLYIFTYHEESFCLSKKQTQAVAKQLKTKVEIIERHIFSPHHYEPDFIFAPGRKFFDLNHGLKIFDARENKIYIDIKGKYEPRHSKKEVFSINQKWVYEKYRVLVHKIVPENFFKRTWVPEKCAWMKGRKVKTRIKKYAGCKLLSELTARGENGLKKDD